MFHSKLVGAFLWDHLPLRLLFLFIVMKHGDWADHCSMALPDSNNITVEAGWLTELLGWNPSFPSLCSFVTWAKKLNAYCWQCFDLKNPYEMAIDQIMAFDYSDAIVTPQTSSDWGEKNPSNQSKVLCSIPLLWFTWATCVWVMRVPRGPVLSG